MPERSLDKRDRRILFELDRNARVRLTTLAQKLKMPIETVRYRIQRIVDGGYIKNFLTVIDGGRLGYFYFKVFLRLHNVNEQTVRKIVADLAANPQICWVIRVDGAYDLGFTPRVTNPIEQSELMDEIRSRYATVIQSWTLSVNVRMDFLSRDYLVGSKREQVLGTYSTKRPPCRMDSLEETVLKQLTTNPRATGAEIAKELGVSTETVLSRIRRLEKEKVIIRYTSVVNCETLGYLNYYVLVFFNRLETDREQQFHEFCRCHPNVVYYIKALGPWDYELSIEVESLDAARQFMMLMTQKFADIIREHNALLVHEIVKYVYP